MPPVVGAMMPFRTGYAWSRPWVCWKDFWSSSSPKATLTSVMPEYSGLASSSFMYLIQVFWLVAFAVADRIAILPLPPMRSEMTLTSLRPISSALAWLMKTFRHSFAASESYVTQAILRDMACLSGPLTALGSLAAMSIESLRLLIRVLW